LLLDRDCDRELARKKEESRIMIAIQFSADGAGQAVYTEALPLSELGQLSMRRASSVEYNENSQQWQVRFADDHSEVAFSHESRRACIEWEIATLNNRLIHGA
jgi:hypothetical protein